jgi:hypothetical protein
MTIDHSPLHNQFVSFWFETSVDGKVQFETMLNFLWCEWHTSRVMDDEVVLTGQLNRLLAEDEMIEEIKPILETAIVSGTI